MIQTQASDFLVSILQGKKVLFITTKNLSYIRNTQELNLIKKYASQYAVIGSSHRGYLARLFHVYRKLFSISFCNYEIILIGFAPQLVLPLFWHKFRKTNVKIVIDFFISVFDTLCCDRKKLHPNGLLGKLLHHLDQNTLLYADTVICDTNTHGQYFMEEFHVPLEKIHTLYLEADTSIYHPMNLTRPSYLNNKFVILYFGSVLPLQGIETVLEAMNILKNHNELYFFFIGPIKSKKFAVSKPSSNNIRYIDWLSQDELAKYINYSDLCLAGHFNASIAKAQRTIPGKAYIYQAIKKPMILGNNPANHELFSNDENVTFVEMGNAKALADAILHLSTLTSRRSYREK